MNSNNVTELNNINSNSSLNVDNSIPDLSKASAGDVTSAIWGITPALVQEISNMNRVYASKHGMFASVPIICRGTDCTYKDICMVSQAQRIVGHRCPMEISAIISRYEQWCNHFDIDTSQDMIDPKDLVDATLIKDLVNIEIQILRAENKIALNGDFMKDILLDIDRKCKPYFGKDIAPEMQFLMILQDKKIKILNQLNATRKDKASTRNKESASEAALEIFQKMKELEHNNKNIVNISDIEFNDDGTVIDTDIQEDTTQSDESNNSKEEAI